MTMSYGYTDHELSHGHTDHDLYLNTTDNLFREACYYVSYFAFNMHSKFPLLNENIFNTIK